jgi:flagellar hook-length control protein FliK
MPIAAIAALPAVAPLAAAPEATEGAEGHGSFAQLLSRSCAEGEPADAAPVPAGRNAGKLDARAAPRRDAVRAAAGTPDDGAEASLPNDPPVTAAAGPDPADLHTAPDTTLHPVMAELLASLQGIPPGPREPSGVALTAQGQVSAGEAPVRRPGSGRAELRAAPSAAAQLIPNAAGHHPSAPADPTLPSQLPPADVTTPANVHAQASPLAEASASPIAPRERAMRLSSTGSPDGSGAAQDLAAAGMLRGDVDARRSERATASDTQALRAVEGGSFASALASAPPAVPTLGQVATQPLPLTLATPLHSPEFPQALGAQVSLLARDGVQHAQLNLNPAEMGPVSVQIVMDGQQAHVQFGADLATTRAAIESSMPALASALSDAGLTLTGGGVSQHASGRGSAQDRQGAADKPGRGTPGAATLPAELASTTTPGRLLRVGGVDLYA